ncbi:MAG: cyclic nucleotide-binding domain-containing protein [Desulfobacteraceae bacterium]|nr:cyclic nucleotide-binding domain-containing protein [Desulfobacteraceae bacterium]
MRRVLLNWLKLHEDEVALFLWTAALLFLLRSSGMVLNNYAETAFLKRYGVQYLPIVNMLNSIATFILTGILALFMTRLQSTRLLGMLFVFCGLSVGGIRLLIPMGLDLIYPLLFMLKSQFELLEALLFWNLANDLYNTRQSKRIFPLLTAGGVIGLIAGSFSTPYMAATLRFDNLLLVYLGISLLGAVLVKAMGMHMRMALPGDKRGKKVKHQPPMREQFQQVLPLIRQSTLVKIVLVLTFMPNVVIPIMNYQFNFAADAYFASESGLLGFFSYFRGVLNIISLVLLLFVGRLYGRFGLPVALMFHPFNYIIAFIAFLTRFDIFSAVYARMSTNIIRTTINMPANSILIGLFPESYRAMVRPFLRGTVVRIALFVGSGLILASANLFHPRYLSLVALPFVLAWLAAPFVLKRRYAAILMDLISRNMLDLKSMEQQNLGKLLKKDQADPGLTEAFLNARGEDALWYARLLKTLDVNNFDDLVARTIDRQDTATRIRLLEMLSDDPGPGTAEMLQRMLYASNEPELTVAVIRTIHRTGSGNPAIRDRLETLIQHPHPEVRGNAAGCLYMKSPGKLKPKIDTWLYAKDINHRKAGVIAAAQTGEKGFAGILTEMLSDADNKPIRSDILRCLSWLSPGNLNDIAAPFLNDPDTGIRRAAIESMEITDDPSLSRIIGHLGDSDTNIAQMAREKIKNAGYINGRILIEALNRPDRRMREAIFELLEELKIKDLDITRFTRQGLFQAYTCLARAEALEKLPESRAKNLLAEHLMEKKNLILENTFRVLAIHDRRGRMWTVFRGLFSTSTRHRANSIELLGDIMDHKMFNMVTPLLEGESISQSLAQGRKYFKLPRFASVSRDLFPELLKEADDWLEPVLTLYVLEYHAEAADRQKTVISQLRNAQNPYIRQMAQKIIPGATGALDPKEQIMDTELTVPEKILLLKNIAIFSGLTVSELGAIAAVTREVAYPPDQVVIAEGDPGDRIYLIIDGEVAVCKGREPEKQIRLDTMGPGDYFGEMALFEKTERSATIRTLKPSRFLVLEKPEFNELVREYPGIALQICTALSQRLRHLQSMVAEAETRTGSQKDTPCK